MDWVSRPRAIGGNTGAVLEHDEKHTHNVNRTKFLMKSRPQTKI